MKTLTMRNSGTEVLAERGELKSPEVTYSHRASATYRWVVIPFNPHPPGDGRLDRTIQERYFRTRKIAIAAAKAWGFAPERYIIGRCPTK